MKKLIVILAVIAMVGAFTATAMADVSLYGSARFRTYYADVDSGVGGVDSDSDLEWRQGFLNRFGANFKSDKITGKLEIDSRAGKFGSTPSVEAGNQGSSTGNLRLRHLWGQWDFGSGKLMIGQNYPLYDAYISGINYYSGGLQKFGGIGYDVARTGQIRLTFGDFRLAFLPPDTAQTAPANSPYTTNEVNTTFPKIEVRYDMKVDNFALNFIGGYQTYQIEDYDHTAQPVGPGTTEDISSYVLGFRGAANFGPAYAKLALTYRQNGANYGAWTVSTHEAPLFEGSSIKDATAFGVVGVLGFKVNDMLTLEGSYAKLKSEVDTSLSNEDDAQAYGVIAKITMAPGVYITPEFIYQDNEDVVDDGVTTEQGDSTIFGVFWKIDFK